MEIKLSKKLIVLMICTIFLMGIASAGWFNWFNNNQQQDEKNTLEKLNITNDFNITKNSIKTNDCLKSKNLNNIKSKTCKEKDLIINNNFFKENSQGIVRFSNG